MAWPARDTRLAFAGRFLPPTVADEIVLAFAATATDTAPTVLLLAHPTDPVSVERRRAWLRDTAPTATLVELPASAAAGAADGGVPGALTAGGEAATRVRDVADALLGPGLRDRALARAVGLPYVPVDVPRTLSVSGSPSVSQLGAWEHLPAATHADLVRRIVVMGPESTGKTTLAADLARRFDTVCVGEYLRLWLDAKSGVCEPSDLPAVVAGQQACEEALARRASRVLFCDTDPLMTAVYSRFYYGTLPPWLDQAASARRADAYLLLDCDVPWVPDPQRDMPHRRHEIRDLCQEELERRGLPWQSIRGSWGERFSAACRVVNDLVREAGGAC